MTKDSEMTLDAPLRLIEKGVLKGLIRFNYDDPNCSIRGFQETLKDLFKAYAAQEVTKVLAATQFVPIADALDEWKGMDVLLGRWNDYAGTIVDMAWGYWDKDNGTWEDEWSKTWTHVALKPAVRGAE